MILMRYYFSIFLILLFFDGEVNAQSIPSSEGTARCSICVPNPNWSIVTGTPDVSDRNIAATTGTSGGGTPWDTAPLPLPPNGDEYWITIRDVGTIASEEAIKTTMTGLVIGREYEVAVYSMSNTADYSPNYIDRFEFIVQGQTLRTLVSPVSQDSWGVSRLRFEATATSRDLTFYPGNNSGATSISGFESVNLSVSLNALNAIPIVEDHSESTPVDVPIDIDLTDGAFDPDGTINTNSVDLDPSTPGIQNTFSNAQGNWSVTPLGVLTFTPAPGFVGVASIPYTIEDNYELDGEPAPATSYPGIISITIQVDTDGDGVPDIDDQDDDNDGILDIYECGELDPSIDFSVANGDTHTFNAPETDLGFVFDIYELDNSFNLNINGVDLATNEIDFQSNHPARNIRFADGDEYGIDVPEIWAMTGNSTTPIVRIRIGPSGNVSMLGCKIQGGPLEQLVPFNGTTFNLITWNTDASNTVIVSQLVDGATYVTGNGSGYKKGFCDPDGDGISNELDLDADGDGCPDAIEGAGDFTADDLEEASGILTTQNPNQNFGTTVDENGIPIIVGPTGQGIGSSQDASVSNCVKLIITNPMLPSKARKN